MLLLLVVVVMRSDLGRFSLAVGPGDHLVVVMVLMTARDSCCFRMDRGSLGSVAHGRGGLLLLMGRCCDGVSATGSPILVCLHYFLLKLILSLLI